MLVMGLIFCLPAPADYQVEDYLGRRVTLTQPAKRIVALAPHIVENLFSAGAGAKIVGVVDYSDYPEAARSIHKVGIISAFSIEAIVRLNPDLVVVWHSGRGGRVMEKLEKLGLTIYASDPRVLDDIPRSIRDYGVLAGTQAMAEKNASSFEQKHGLLAKKYGKAERVEVLYQIWNKPIQTLNGQHIISDVIRLCGGTNAFADALALAPKISLESVIQRNPEVIVASGMAQERPEWLDQWRRWPHLKAVQLDNLYSVPPDIIQRHTLRILDGADMICEFLSKARVNRR